jgi:hypothetical protein
MISALLSNTSAGSLRGSGLAADIKTATDEHMLGRGALRPNDSAAAPQSKAQTSGNIVPLTTDAVLALQDSQALAKDTEDAGQEGDAETGEPQGETEDAEAITAQQQNPAAEPSGEDADKDGDELTEEEEKQVRDLQQRDQEVRAHEQAHARVGGPYASAPSYTFQQGPDGKRYAIGGEVQIDTATERTPEATVRKMQIVIRAATAPAEPSSQDLKVAQQARSQLAEAQAELRQQKADELQSGPGGSDDGGTDTPETGETAKDKGPASAADESDPKTGEIPGGSDNAANRLTANAVYADTANRMQDIISAGQDLGLF